MRSPSLLFRRSGIHGWGVFAAEAIKAGQYITEYRGEIIRPAVADLREVLYEKLKVRVYDARSDQTIEFSSNNRKHLSSLRQVGSDYMFKVSKDAIIDATFKGSLARYINASCSPNCVTKIITAGSARVVIYALTDIEVGEELVYDYKFPLAQGDEEILKCYCGAENCRVWMNWLDS